MPKPVSDMFVATRSTQSLDKLVTDELLPFVPQWSTGESHQQGNDAFLSTKVQQSEHEEPLPLPSLTSVEPWMEFPSSWHNVCSADSINKMKNIRVDDYSNHNMCSSHSRVNMNNSRSDDYSNFCSTTSVSQANNSTTFPCSSSNSVSFANYPCSSSNSVSSGNYPCTASNNVSSAKYPCNASSNVSLAQYHYSSSNNVSSGNHPYSASNNVSSANYPCATSALFSSYSPISCHEHLFHQRPAMYNSLSNSGVIPRESFSTESEFSSFPGDDGDENYIPFEQTKVSRFGPISRLSKVRSETNAPVQVTADSRRPLPPTAAGHGHEHHQMIGQPIPSTRLSSLTHTAQQGVRVLVGEPAVKPTALEKRSIWDQSPQPSYQNIAQLMAGAAGAVSNNEKLAYQLQAVELEISMKTGRKPEPVRKMIQAAVAPTTVPDQPGMMEVMATGHVTDCLKNLQLGNVTKADEIFEDMNGVSK